MPAAISIGAGATSRRDSYVGGSRVLGARIDATGGSDRIDAAGGSVRALKARAEIAGRTDLPPIFRSDEGTSIVIDRAGGGVKIEAGMVGTASGLTTLACLRTRRYTKKSDTARMIPMVTPMEMPTIFPVSLTAALAAVEFDGGTTTSNWRVDVATEVRTSNTVGWRAAASAAERRACSWTADAKVKDAVALLEIAESHPAHVTDASAVALQFTAGGFAPLIMSRTRCTVLFAWTPLKYSASAKAARSLGVNSVAFGLSIGSLSTRMVRSHSSVSCRSAADDSRRACLALATGALPA